MPTLANAHFVDSDITETASGVDSWDSDTDDPNTYYGVAFDNASGTILASEAITNVSYDYLNDDNCISAWLFDSTGEILTDSKGSDTLTSNGSPTVNTSIKAQGAGSLDLVAATSDFMSITDTALSTDFPLKSTDATKNFSFAAWIRFDAIDNYDSFYSKWEDAGDKRCLSLGVTSDGGQFNFYAAQAHTDGTAGNVQAFTDDSFTVVADTWYHVGFTYEDSTKAWKFRLWDGATAYSKAGVATNNIYVNTAPVTIGRYTSGGQFDGKIDEVLVFDDILTDDEIDLIRTGGDVTKTGTCSTISYTTSVAGYITYKLDSGATQFADDDFIYNGTDVIQADGTPALSGGGKIGVQNRTTAHPTTLAHIEGQAVDVLDDGVVVENSTIASGVVSPAITGVTHQGLNYVSTLTPSKLNLEMMGWVIVKNITKLIVSFLYTLKGKCGTNNIERPTALAEMETVAFGTELFTGIKEVPVYGGYEREGDLIVKQDEPLPMICRGVIIDLGAYDT